MTVFFIMKHLYSWSNGENSPLIKYVINGIDDCDDSLLIKYVINGIENCMYKNNYYMDVKIIMN